MERLWKPCRFILQSAALFITLLMILVVLLMPDVGHRTWLRLQEALTNHDTPGFQKRWYFDENGDAHAYSLFVPHNLTPTDRPPVILFLNGLGEDGTDGVMPLTNGLGRAVWEIQRVFPFVCVFPQRHPNEDWDPGGTAIQRSLGILRQTEGEFHTDPDRVYLTGISTGAIAAWSLAAAHPDRFAALFPVSGTYSPSETERIADAGIPVWISYNAEDSPALVNANRSVHTHLLLRGLSPCFTEIGGTAICQRDSHDAWSFAYRNGALYSWLLRQKKANRSIGNKRFHPVRPHRVLSESGDTSVIVPGIVDTDFELHAEFRPVDNFTCGFAVVCPPQQATSDISVRFTITSPEAGSGFVRVSGPEQPATVHCSDIAQGSIAKGAWNDLRIRCTASQLIVHVNGWELCDVALENALPTDGILTLTSALNGAGPIEWRNIRSRGLTGPATPGHLERVAAVVTNLHDHRAAPAVSIETIVARWNELEQTAAGQTIAWRTLREGDRRWSPFQAAVHPQPDDSDWSCTQVSTDRATVTTLWASPFVECDRNGLHDGLHMHNFNLFRTALRNDDTPRFATGRYQLTLDASRKTEFVSAGDTRDAHLTVISPLMNENGSLPLRAEELFNRLLLSALLPLKVYGNAVTPQNCRIEPHLGSFHGTDCVVLTETPSGAGWTRRLFIDPQHDFRICGSWTRHDDGTWDQISYHYDHGPDSQPTPYSWTLVSTRKGEETFHAYAGQERLLVHGTANVISPPDRVQTGMHHAPQTGILYDTQHGLWARQLPNDQQQPLAADDATRRLMPASLRKSSGPELSQWRLATFSGLALVSALVLLARTRRNACRRSVSPFPDH